jgi:digeranylgeranylglycerophospholipid reductase
MDNEYDVIVVGAGPAGSLAAKTAAENGMKVLLIEKRQEIGSPVRCAEGIGKTGLEEFIEPDSKFISAEVFGARLYAPDGTAIDMLSKNRGAMGYVLERKIFDRELSRIASESGAEVLTKAQATSLIIEDGYVKGIKGKHIGEDFSIRSKIVVGSDGVESRMAIFAGINSKLKLNDVDSCAQFLISGVDVPDYCEFYIGNHIAPGGYVWVFPKGNRQANIGLGVIGSKIKNKHPVEYLKEFVEKHYPQGKILSTIVGADPISGALPRLSTAGFILAGDAAHLSDPMTGGGIYNAMLSGRIAGEVSAEAIRSGDLSDRRLKKYDREIYKQIGNQLNKNYKLKEFFISLDDSEINSIAHTLKGVDFEEYTAVKLVKEVVSRNPFLLKHLAGFI